MKSPRWYLALTDAIEFKRPLDCQLRDNCSFCYYPAVVTFISPSDQESESGIHHRRGGCGGGGDNGGDNGGDGDESLGSRSAELIEVLFADSAGLKTELYWALVELKEPSEIPALHSRTKNDNSECSSSRPSLLEQLINRSKFSEKEGGY